MSKPAVPEPIELAEWARASRPSPIQDMLDLLSRPNLQSLALGLPAPTFFPTRAIGEAASEVLASDPRALQYQAAIGELRERIVDLMALRGVTCRASQVFVTSGAQQGMALLARILLSEGSEIVSEDLVYTGFQQVLEPYRLRTVTVPHDLDTGIDVDAVEAALRQGKRPRLLYTMSDGHNPSGVSMPAENRRRLVELAGAYGTPIIEDDAYGLLTFDDAPTPPMRSHDDRVVLYVGSFSKILAPGLRVGWLVVPETLIDKLGICKEAADINTTTFSQRVVLELLRKDAVIPHIQSLRKEYRARRDAMLDALAAFMPSDAKWTHPRAGMFTWLRLPSRYDTAKLLEAAVERRGVAFLPGHGFGVGASMSSCMRLCFSHLDADGIRDAVAKLAEIITEEG